MTTMRRAARQGRHVLEDGPRPSIRRIRVGLRVTPGRLAAVAAAVLLGVFGAAGAAAGSFAYLNSTATIGSNSTVTAGTSSLTLQSGANPAGTAITLPATVWNRMLPGDIVGQTITVNNTGDTPLTVSTRLSVAIAWDIRVAAGACPGTQLPGAAQTTTSTTYATIAAGATSTMCIQALLPTTASNVVQGTAPVVSLIVDGVQVP
ncbi:hypothetical protein BH09ACT4_BH09ACT4_17190 [soil metagenome]